MKITRKILIIYTLIWIFTSALIVVSSDYLKEVMYEESIKDVLNNATYILIAINCFVVLIMGVITTRIFEKKITLLNTEINNINTNNTTSGRIHESNDEFSVLIKDINSMFQSMEEKNNIIAYNEKKYSTILEGLDNGYAYFKILKDASNTVRDAFFVEVNGSLANMIGMREKDIIAASFSKVFKDLVKDKDIVPKVLNSVGRKSQKILRYSVRLGVDKWAYLTVYPIEEEYFAVILTDISENKNFAEEMKRIANYDVLTGIQNRYSIYNYLDELQSKKEHFTVYYIDLDNFKTINDTLGHNVGDEVLVRAAETVSKMGGDKLTMGRLGGDEFIAILLGQYTIEEVREVGQSIIDNLNSVVSRNAYSYRIEASLGAARFMIDSDKIEKVLKFADIAMYKSKKNGGNRINVFDNTMVEEAIMETRIKDAIKDNLLEPYFQPIYSLNEKRVIGAEALSRWNDKNAVIEPVKFISIAKRTGDIADIDNFILKEACKFCSKIRMEKNSSFQVSVNASYKFLNQRNVVNIIKSIINETKLNPGGLIIEITEDELLDDIENIVSILTEIRKIGVKIALDDFGVGYSSFGYIKMLPIDIIKIDRSLLKKVEEDKKTLAIISALIQLAHSINLEVIAEGIELDEQLKLLRGLYCDAVQGFLLSKPVQKEQFPLGIKDI